MNSGVGGLLGADVEDVGGTVGDKVGPREGISEGWRVG